MDHQANDFIQWLDHEGGTDFLGKCNAPHVHVLAHFRKDRKVVIKSASGAQRKRLMKFQFGERCSTKKQKKKSQEI